jgi:hypothetical protein
MTPLRMSKKRHPEISLEDAKNVATESFRSLKTGTGIGVEG